MPQNPAARASDRQVSSGMWPPSSRRSSFDQPMGLAPMRTVMPCVDPSLSRRLVRRALLAAGLLVVAAQLAPRRALRDLRHRDIPPVAAGGGGEDRKRVG